MTRGCPNAGPGALPDYLNGRARSTLRDENPMIDSPPHRGRGLPASTQTRVQPRVRRRNLPSEPRRDPTVQLGSSLSPVPNGAGCTGLGFKERFDVGAINCIFSLGALTSYARRAVATPPHRSRHSLARGPRGAHASPKPDTECGLSFRTGPEAGRDLPLEVRRSDPVKGKFCYRWAAPRPGVAPSGQPSAPPSVSPGPGRWAMSDRRC